MLISHDDKAQKRRDWLARIVVGIVFAINVSAAASYIVSPAKYVAAYELEGVVGRVMVQALGILFLMWNATYPPVIINPTRHLTLFGVVLAQQLIGLVGELLIMASLPSGHDALFRTGLRFVIFDGLGFLAMSMAYFFMRRSLGHLTSVQKF